MDQGNNIARTYIVLNTESNFIAPLMVSWLVSIHEYLELGANSKQNEKKNWLYVVRTINRSSKGLVWISLSLSFLQNSWNAMKVKGSKTDNDKTEMKFLESSQNELTQPVQWRVLWPREAAWEVLKFKMEDSPLLTVPSEEHLVLSSVCLKYSPKPESKESASSQEKISLRGINLFSFNFYLRPLFSICLFMTILSDWFLVHFKFIYTVIESTSSFNNVFWDILMRWESFQSIHNLYFSFFGLASNFETLQGKGPKFWACKIPGKVSHCFQACLLISVNKRLFSYILILFSVAN